MNGRRLIGLILIILGGGFILQQADIWDFSSFLADAWPIVFIIIGLFQLVGKERTSSFTGLIFILVGLMVLANNILDVNIAIYIWPAILIIAGFSFLFTRSTVKRRPMTDGATNAYAIFSGQNIRDASHDYEGGQVSAVFGGVQIDLRDVQISEKGATLELNAVFGGIEVFVPDHVNIQISGLPIFGGCEDKTRRRSTDALDGPVLKINYSAVFGGVEIKS